MCQFRQCIEANFHIHCLHGTKTEHHLCNRAYIDNPEFCNLAIGVRMCQSMCTYTLYLQCANFDSVLKLTSTFIVPKLNIIFAYIDNPEFCNLAIKYREFACVRACARIHSSVRIPSMCQFRQCFEAHTLSPWYQN